MRGACGVEEDILDGLFGRGNYSPHATITARMGEAIRHLDLIGQAVARGDTHVIQSLAETASEKRFDGVNEFRAILTDQQKTFITRNEWGSQHHALEDKINALENRATLSEGKGEGKHTFWSYIVGGIGLISLVVTIIHVLASK